MIRLIGRRLIIPQCDTGTLTIPTQGSVDDGDIAILAIYDTLTNTVAKEKEIQITGPTETLTFDFTSEDTVNIEPDDRGNRYVWDIVIKRVDHEGNSTGFISVDSYYAAFSLPPCIIKRVTRNVQE